ncbi:mobile mystery protein A [Chryseobacterium sp. MDT2-18]|uniref:mobile mystery protein A n=1 Tax=Chryseobacterium sp. MDT2-18 TaxID=1259136 RepID=UPI0027853DA9|nr:mobile mystery protein A [Chryseobacterium sp. MDT2-18]MDQ0476463.1 putative DNA-binding mobile mystery protein A [Chryseobacterium sp. MDT2-18]
MRKKSLQLQQITHKLNQFSAVEHVAMPPTGWIKAIRTSLGMSMQQLGEKLSVSKQAVQDLERREQEESITLKSLREAGNAMDLRLVYGFIPKDGSLDHLIERKARELAKDVVLRSSNTMKLEDQENSQERLVKAIEERTEAIIKEMPKILWD